MWRSINTSFSKYSIELAQLLCRCLKDPFKDKALARYKLNLKQTNYLNGVPQPPEKNDIPNEIAKIFTFKDRNSKKIELECANEQILNSKNCDKNVCETCCILSLSSKFNKEFSKSEAPVNCKMRCFNSTTVTDITQDSLETLNEYLVKIDSLYNVQPPKIHIEGSKCYILLYQL
uniref:Uncharacterized protein n=1 Tax=Theileria annulata TaxID=5874 RepID=A0A3B0MUE3_THEAN